ncbi:MAG: DNA damage-inducible protein D [Alphaproteobacteria bacterium]|nr:DNA damage-inducible protein D [Alphaproteobacteria bacterium]
MAGSTQGDIDGLIATFEDAAHIDEDGIEFWYARSISKLLEYGDYRNFLNIIEKAKTACKLVGQAIENHFVDVTDMVPIGSDAHREIDNIKLTRYACYLIAQNGDPRKRPVAFAQTYFAIQARRQEIADIETSGYSPLSEDQKRLLLRDEIKEHNKALASAAKGAGVIEPSDFAIFQTFGYKGLYGGLDRLGIQRRKGLNSKQHILDHMGSTELAANLFRATQTEDKLRRDNIKGKNAANNVHFEVGAKVRQTIKEIGGVMPENLPVEEDIKKVERRVKKLAKSNSTLPSK